MSDNEAVATTRRDRTDSAVPSSASLVDGRPDPGEPTDRAVGPLADGDAAKPEDLRATEVPVTGTLSDSGGRPVPVPIEAEQAAGVPDSRTETSTRDSGAAPSVVEIASAPVPTSEGAGDPEDDSGDLAPGDVALPPAAGLWPDGAVEGLRERWQRVQLRFVDDPSGAAAEADDLVDEAVRTLTDVLAAQRAGLAAWRGAEGSDDTERLRVAVRGYRTFLDHVLAV